MTGKTKRTVSVPSDTPVRHYAGTGMATRRLVARWESVGGAHIVELSKADGSGYYYRAAHSSGIGAGGGYLGNDILTDEAAIAEFAPLVNDFQPDTNRRPMRRTR